MKFNSKNYKIKKLKNILKKKKIIFFFQSTNEKCNKWILTEQKLLQHNIDYYKLNSSLANLVLNNSIFFNLSKLITGSIIVLYFDFFLNKKKFNKIFFDIKINNFYVLCLIFKNKFYHIKSISNLIFFKFINSIKLLTAFLKQLMVVLFLPKFFMINKKLFSK